MSDVKSSSLNEERQHLRYRGNKIPLFVRLIWIGYWVFAIYYAIQFFLPALQQAGQ
jgi:hypothetical protein